MFTRNCPGYGATASFMSSVMVVSREVEVFEGCRPGRRKGALKPSMRVVMFSPG